MIAAAILCALLTLAGAPASGDGSRKPTPAPPNIMPNWDPGDLCEVTGGYAGDFDPDTPHGPFHVIPKGSVVWVKFDAGGGLVCVYYSDLDVEQFVSVQHLRKIDDA